MAFKVRIYQSENIESLQFVLEIRNANWINSIKILQRLLDRSISASQSVYSLK